MQDTRSTANTFLFVSIQCRALQLTLDKPSPVNTSTKLHVCWEQRHGWNGEANGLPSIVTATHTATQLLENGAHTERKKKALQAPLPVWGAPRHHSKKYFLMMCPSWRKILVFFHDEILLLLLYLVVNDFFSLFLNDNYEYK